MEKRKIGWVLYCALVFLNACQGFPENPPDRLRTMQAESEKLERQVGEGVFFTLSPKDQLSLLQALPFGCFVFQNDSLLLWNREEVAQPRLLSEGMQYLPDQDSTALYELRTIREYQLIAQYPLAEILGEAHFLCQKGKPIYGSTALGLAYCPLEASNARNKNAVLLVTSLLVLILFWWLSFRWAFTRPRGGILTIIGGLFLIYLIEWQGWGATFQWFQPSFGPGAPARSHGGLVLMSLQLVIGMLFFNQAFQAKDYRGSTRSLKVRTISAYWAAAMGLLVITYTIRSLVDHTDRALNYGNFFRMQWEDGLTLWSGMLLFFALYLFTHRLLVTVRDFPLSNRFQLTALLIGAALSLPFTLVMPLGFHPLVLFLIILSFLLLFDLFTDIRLESLTWPLTWIFIFSVFGAVLFYKYSIQKDFERMESLARLLERQDLEGLKAVDSSLSVACYDGSGQLIAYNNFPPPSTMETQVKAGRVSKDLNSRRARLDFGLAEGGYLSLIRPLDGYLRPILLFSYLFWLLLLSLGLFLLFSRWSGRRLQAIDLPLPGRTSLRRRVQWSTVIIVAASFLVIGLVTVSNYRQTRLLRVEREQLDGFLEVRDALEQALSSGETMDSLTGQQILMEAKGQLFASDGKAIAEKSTFLHTYLPVRVLEEFRAGTLLFTFRNQLYLPLELNNAEPAVLGFPFQPNTPDLQAEVFDFMGTLLSIYAFLLLAAASVAFLAANSIAQPIQQIGERLGSLQLAANQPLIWESDDEIGDLVRAYNSALKKLEESTEQLKQKEREGAWREMARQVAHEIKNPLTPMKLKLQHLEYIQQVQPERARALLPDVSRTLIEQINGLDRIAGAFSSYARLPEARPERLDWSRQVRDAASLFEGQRAESYKIQVELPSEPVWVKADRNHLVRILNNLLSNAIQALLEEQAGKVIVRLNKGTETARLSITDNGTGIPEDKQSRLFQPYFTTKSSGTGLGLAMTKNMVETADGKIDFETEAGVGTTFWVELPLNE